MPNYPSLSFILFNLELNLYSERFLSGLDISSPRRLEFLKFCKKREHIMRMESVMKLVKFLRAIEFMTGARSSSQIVRQAG